MENNNNWKKNIILFLTSQNISLFGSALVQYAITWYITLETQSGVMMMISIICGFVPAFILSPFAGVWADRYNKKTLIILSDSLIAIATLILAILFFMGYNSIWLLFIASAIRSAGSGIQMPAVSSFLPSIVPTDKLTKVNAINSSVQSFVTLLSPMLSGLLITITTLEVIFLIDVITAAIAILISILFVHVVVNKNTINIENNSYFEDVRKGISYIINHKFVKTLFIFCAIYFILIVPLAFLTPIQVTRSFGTDVWRLTAIEVAYSTGMIIGGIIMVSWGGFKNMLHTMTLSYLVEAICTVALGIVPLFSIYLVLMVIIGFAVPFFNTPFTVLLQKKVEPDYLGRVFGVLGMISGFIMPLAMLLYGPISDFIKIEWLLIATGILMFIQCLNMFYNKVLFEAGKQ